MATFDIESLAEEAIRERYRRLALRSQSVAKAMHEGFGDSRLPIEMAFIDEQHFNAYASSTSDAYRIELAAPVPLLTVLLFERLLSDARILPWLGTDGPDKASYDVPFIIDPAAFETRHDWSIGLSRVRSLAAGLLADLALTFVMLHEVGHVLCGHVDALRTSGSTARLAELFAAVDADPDETDRSLAWEADADAVAASLLLDYIDEVVTVQDRHADAKLIFARGNTTVEHVLSLSIVALYALFCYLRGTRYELGLSSSHPHPFVRAHYVKDMLVTAASQRWPLDLEALFELIDERLDEMLIMLEELGLSDNVRFDDAYIDATNDELARLTVLRNSHRPSARAWFAWHDVTLDPNEDRE